MSSRFRRFSSLLACVGLIGMSACTNELTTPAPARTDVTTPGPPMRSLTLTLTQGEQLSGPWAGTVTTPQGYSCTLNQRDPSIICPALSVQDGSSVDLLVTLAPHLVDLGFPIRNAAGCDALTDKVCRVLMNADRSVTISIGWSVLP